VRKHVVVAVLVLGVAGATIGASAFGASSAATRLATKTSAKTTPSKRTHRPYKFTTSGKISFTPNLVCPTGQTNPIYCTRPPAKCNQGLSPGLVAVRYKVGTNTISLRRAVVGTDCTYKSTVTFKRSRLSKFKSFTSKKGLRLKVTERFLGDANLLPSGGPTHFVRVKG
jgi:hypothetical protein